MRANEFVKETTFGGQEVEGNPLVDLQNKFPKLSTLLYFVPGLGQAMLAADLAGQVQMYNQAMAKVDQKYPIQAIQAAQQSVGDTTEWEPVDENFKDGRNPQDKGDSKRYNVPTKSSVSNLRKVAKHSSGRKAQLAHWMANMKAGRAKND
jgi:hypothetical protein